MGQEKDYGASPRASEVATIEASARVAERKAIVRTLRAMAAAETRAAKRYRTDRFWNHAVHARTCDDRALALKDAANRIATRATASSEATHDARSEAVNKPNPTTPED